MVLCLKGLGLHSSQGIAHIFQQANFIVQASLPKETTWKRIVKFLGATVATIAECQHGLSTGLRLSARILHKPLITLLLRLILLQHLDVTSSACFCLADAVDLQNCMQDAERSVMQTRRSISQRAEHFTVLASPSVAISGLESFYSPGLSWLKA